jgi:hypothetical protein
MHNSKRYSYPRSVYINTHDPSDSYLTYKPLDSSTIKQKNIIKFTPLRLFSLANSGVELSYERKTGKQFSTELMGTYLLSSNIFDQGGFRPNIRGYRMGVEEKFYLHKMAPFGPYLGFGINHLDTHYNHIAEFGPKGINSHDNNLLESYSDSILIYKKTTDFNLVIGYQKKAGKILLDYYCGLGIRNRNVLHRNRINPEDEMVSPIDLNFNYSSNVEGKNTTPIFLLGIKVGWMF